MKSRILTASVVVLALIASACDDGNTGEQMKKAVEDAAGQAAATVEAGAGPTLKARASEASEALATTGQEIRATVGASSGDIRATAESAATEVGEAVSELKAGGQRLDGWTADVVAAMKTLGDQAAALEDDSTLITDEEWRSTTREAIAVLQDRAADAEDVASEIEEDATLRRVAGLLNELGASVGETANELAGHLEAADAAGFLEATDELTNISTGIDRLRGLVGALRR